MNSACELSLVVFTSYRYSLLFEWNHSKMTHSSLAVLGRYSGKLLSSHWLGILSSPSERIYFAIAVKDNSILYSCLYVNGNTGFCRLCCNGALSAIHFKHYRVMHLGVEDWFLGKKDKNSNIFIYFSMYIKKPNQNIESLDLRSLTNA